MYILCVVLVHAGLIASGKEWLMLSKQGLASLAGLLLCIVSIVCPLFNGLSRLTLSNHGIDWLWLRDQCGERQVLEKSTPFRLTRRISYSVDRRTIQMIVDFSEIYKGCRFHVFENHKFEWKSFILSDYGIYLEDNKQMKLFLHFK